MGKRYDTPVVLTEDGLRDVLDGFLHSPVPAFTFDVESVGEHRGVPAYNEVTWLSMATDGITAVIPMGHPIGSNKVGEYREPRKDKNGKVRRFRMPIWDEPPKQLTPECVFGTLAPLFLSDTIVKTAHGLPTFDAPTIEKYLPEPIHQPMDCTLTLRWLINENLKVYGLKPRTKFDYGVDYDQDDTGKCVEKHPFDLVAHYAYMDAVYAWLIYRKYRPAIEEEELEEVHDLEVNLMPALTRMRLQGMPVDVPRLKRLETTLARRLVRIESEVYQAAGKRFNINSNPQKQQVLFGPRSEGGQGLKPWKMTDGARKKQKLGGEPGINWWSTDDEVLESYPRNDLANSLRDYQECIKLLSTYVRSWLGEQGNPKKPCRIINKRLYFTLKQFGADTGRFSSEQPNVQNIPRPDTDDGKLIRGAFVAPDLDSLLCVADYGQIELVILAHLIGHGALYDGFWQGIDPHLVCASKVLQIPPEDVTKDQRQTYGKTLGFTIVNGAGPQRVASMTGKPLREAKSILLRHEREFPEIYDYKQQVYREARKRKPVPYIRTLFGRKRRISYMLSGEQGMRRFAERQIFNCLIQGGAADLMKLGLTRTDALYQEQLPEAYLISTIHDELVGVTPKWCAEQARSLMVEGMTGPGIQKYIKVPLTVDSAVVSRWSDAK
jgi:DNA polymerase-1